jgi:hypothetical protein
MRKIQRNLDPDIVRQMMKEFRRSEASFYEKYGGGRSLGYDLIDEDGYRYPPAAIVQAALELPDVKGGVKARDSAGRALRLHGFRVLAKGELLTSPPKDIDVKLEQLKRIAQIDKQSTSKARPGAAALRSYALRHRLRCEVTGVADQGLLRVSHIVPWSESREDRLNPENVILLSALWDLSLDRGFVSFDSSGVAIFSSGLSADAKRLLIQGEALRLSLSDERQAFLRLHRKKYGFE